MKKMLAVLLLLYPLTAAAETYQWTDERGTVNFAEDLGKVPKKYRKKAKRLGSEEGAPPRVVTEPEPPRQKAEEQKGAKKLYGGKEETAWRREFLQAASDLQGAQTEVEALKGRLQDTSKMTRTEYLSLQNSLKIAESRVQVQQRKLDQLRETAERYGVPAEFRK